MVFRRLCVYGCLLALAAGLLPACSVNTEYLEADYGRSVSNNLVGQFVNPRAGQVNTPAAGLDPVSSANLLGKYEKSFQVEEGRPMLQLTTGTR
ncbi:MAG: hypothetical protein K6T55_05995 [Syntrophobacterales bacterium]|nr:hypothetical protein [Syntrophobacterales bacterium]